MGGSEGGRDGAREGGRNGEREGAKEGRSAPPCIVMCHNVLFDTWKTYFYVMAIMEWVHIEWIGVHNREPE